MTLDRARTPLVPWPEARDGHGCPLRIVQLGDDVALESRNVSWLRALREANAAHETELTPRSKFESEVRERDDTKRRPPQEARTRRARRTSSDAPAAREPRAAQASARTSRFLSFLPVFSAFSALWPFAAFASDLPFLPRSRSASSAARSVFSQVKKPFFGSRPK